MLHIVSPFLLKNLVIGNGVNEISTTKSIIESSVGEENDENIVYHFNKEYWDKPMTITLENAYWDLSRVHTNNWRRMHGMNLLPYRKMFKHDTKYALTIYNKQRKYIRDRYTFEDWRKMKGIN